jgi:cytochrome c biogenesis protein CcmG/thiol:disulfide interchange protein DsbE
MFRFLRGLAIGSTLLVGVAASPTNLRAAASDRKSAPNFSLDDSQGKTLKLSDFRGKVVLLDFWATWCHGCKTEIPWFMEFHKKYESDGLAVIGVSMDDDGWKSVKPFIAEWKIKYPIVVGNQQLGKLYSIDAMPVTLLIDREGRIAETRAGVVVKDSFEKEIANLLSEGK